jgi:hypothetical protein
MIQGGGTNRTQARGQKSSISASFGGSGPSSILTGSTIPRHQIRRVELELDLPFMPNRRPLRCRRHRSALTENVQAVGVLERMVPGAGCASGGKSRAQTVEWDKIISPNSTRFRRGCPTSPRLAAAFPFYGRSVRVRPARDARAQLSMPRSPRNLRPAPLISYSNIGHDRPNRNRKTFRGRPTESWSVRESCEPDCKARRTAGAAAASSSLRRSSPPLPRR